MRYLMVLDRRGSEAREEFKVDVRAGLLVAFSFYFMNIATTLSAGANTITREGIMESIRWFSSAIDDWDCAESVGGVSVDGPQKRKRAYMKKSKRRASAAPVTKT